MSSRIKSLRVSTRLMLVNAAILIFTLLLTSFLTIAGLYYSVYHQAEVELEGTVENMLRSMEKSETLSDTELPEPPPYEMREWLRRQNPDWMPIPPFVRMFYREGLLPPGVVLRIRDEDGRKVVDSAMHYPATEEVEAHTLSDPPFWASADLKVALLGNFYMYYKSLDVTWHGHLYTLYFFRIITAERVFLQMLARGLVLTNAIGIALALLACYYVSRRALRPIRTISEAAREIEVTDLGRRIDVPPAEDELTDLVVTINHMLGRLQEGFEQQRQFVSDASHELRTPVTVMLGYSEMLSRWGREDAETLDEGITAIRSEAENMKALIERLLFLARADQKRQALKKEPLDFRALVADVARKAELMAGDHTLTLEANEPGTVFADAVLMRQMLRVFVENAFKYTPAGGSVTIASRRAGDALAVTISDTGIGIAPEHQAKVFDRFYRVDSSRTRVDGETRAGGTGLGLAIARWIAEAHDIGLSLESEPGVGTTIRLSIPLCKEDASE